MTPEDHYLMAEQLMDQALTSPVVTDRQLELVLMSAQVHATLALAKATSDR